MANEKADELLIHPAVSANLPKHFGCQGGFDVEKTETRKLAEEYMLLGGTRQVMIDDNKTFVRQYDNEPEEAERFWQERIATLDKERIADVEFFLPSVNSDVES
ncbi:hypothetical protein QE369_001522 [Agrobacterium larrymoorei]|uniref:Uncharacterized protein n=1 Tax=Agrobacterium larrymoorei TaxID=160699 RepID=A0AAJ2BEE4_9HYPH|nr:hypothetical protein [Agrobacterium larrymoorei]